MNVLRVAFCSAALALLTAASPAVATTTVVTADYAGDGYQGTGGAFLLGPGQYRINLLFSDPVSDFDGNVEKTFSYDAFCDLATSMPCGGDDVPIDISFQMVTPELYQLLLTIDGPHSIILPPGHFEAREDTHESCCGFGFNFTSFGAGHFTLSYASVPEPATWAMMVLGFGAVGFAARRKAPKGRLATS